MQARLIKGIQKPRPEFETVGACLIMLHGISDAGANFECWYVEFLGHQEQHLDPNTSVGRSWHRWSRKSTFEPSVCNPVYSQILPILSILAELSLTALSHVFTYLTTFFICFYLSH